MSTPCYQVNFRITIISIPCFLTSLSLFGGQGLCPVKSPPISMMLSGLLLPSLPPSSSDRRPPCQEDSLTCEGRSRSCSTQEGREEGGREKISKLKHRKVLIISTCSVRCCFLTWKVSWVVCFQAETEEECCPSSAFSLPFHPIQVRYCRLGCTWLPQKLEDVLPPSFSPLPPPTRRDVSVRVLPLLPSTCRKEQVDDVHSVSSVPPPPSLFVYT